MSFQAVTWAIEQRAGSPSAKATLWSIANYANENWCAWPSQKKICEDSEQSPDAVQKRLPELVARGLIRRVPLTFAGRRTVDFIILRPSPFFDAAIENIEPHLPRGCSVYVNSAAADSGSAAADSGSATADSGISDAAAISGSRCRDQRLTLPQIAATATALERQQEPVIEPVIGRACARASPRSTGRRLQDDWQPSLDDMAFAHTILTEEQTKLEVDRFRDYWIAKSGPHAVKRSWSATWRNWCRRANEIAQPRYPPRVDIDRLSSGKRMIGALNDMLEDVRRNSHPRGEDDYRLLPPRRGT